MSKVKFKLNRPGLNALMKSQEMKTILNEYGERVVSTANGNVTDPEASYSMSVETLDWTSVAQIRADNGAAMHENYEHNTLLKALGGGGR